MAFIREKRKGITVYYELVKSTREGGKVRQKVMKYLGSRGDMLSYCKRHRIKPPKDTALLNKSTTTMLEKKLKELNSLRPLPKETLKQLNKKFEVEMTYNSNAIEGNTLTLRETYLVIERGMTIGGKSVEEHLEATNHKEAIHFMAGLVRKKRVTMNDVLGLHAIILDKINPQGAGFFRHKQVYIAGTNHVPPSWKKVPGLMKEVVKELNSREKGAKAVESAVRVHFMVAWIHPFVDGNGRLARLLANLRLMRAGFPPAIVKKGIRKTYYNALDYADAGDLRPLTQMSARDVKRALDLYIGAAK
ncbi:MAG: Fic family protein [Candidatus Diapherotrites archaeon]|nr:Fic family protein [Candidatus Diapherotrites archaeon]